MPLVRFTNGVLLFDGEERSGDLYVDTASGTIVPAPADPASADVVEDTVDLAGALLSPGLIDVQLNGACGLNFTEAHPPDVPAADVAAYADKVHAALRGLLATGVTSFLPTITTAARDIMQASIPYYRPNGHLRDPARGAESLGVHLEGPFIAPVRKGAHDPTKIQALAAGRGAASIVEFYGPQNFVQAPDGGAPAIRMITLAPEAPGMLDAIRELTQTHGTLVALGHADATYAQGLEGLKAGATMITHTFNAMPPLHHREPGLVGLIGAPLGDLGAGPGGAADSGTTGRPFFGLITDEIHLHPAPARLAWAAHEDGCCVVTDGTAFTGMPALPDGLHVVQQGRRRVIKAGRKLFLEGTDTICGGTSTLVQCVSNLRRWTGIGPARAVLPATANPARLLGLEGKKGTLRAGADADLVVLRWEAVAGQMELVVQQVWKFGQRVL